MGPGTGSHRHYTASVLVLLIGGMIHVVCCVYKILTESQLVLFPFITLALATIALRKVGQLVDTRFNPLCMYVTGHFHGSKVWVKTPFVLFHGETDEKVWRHLEILWLE